MKKVFGTFIFGLLVFTACKKEEVNEDQSSTNNSNNNTQATFPGMYNMTDSVFDNTNSVEFYGLTVVEVPNSQNQIMLIGYASSSDTIIANTSGANFSLIKDTINQTPSEGTIVVGTGSIESNKIYINTNISYINGIGTPTRKGVGVK